MTAPTPMSDERLAELEAYAEPGCYVKSWYVRELVAEVRRGRDADLTLNEIGARLDFSDEWDADDVVELVDTAHADRDEANAEVERLQLSREHPHSAKLTARILRAEDRVEELEKENAELRTSELFCGVCAAGVESSEHHERCLQPLEQAVSDRDRLRNAGETSMRIYQQAIEYLFDLLGFDDSTDDEDCIPGCDAGIGGIHHLIWHLGDQRDRARSIAVALEGQVAAVRELSAGLIHGGGCGLETGDPCDCGHQAVLRALDGGAT